MTDETWWFVLSGRGRELHEETPEHRYAAAVAACGRRFDGYRWWWWWR